MSRAIVYIYVCFAGEKAVGIMMSGRMRGLLPRRALIAIAPPDQAPALAPTLEPEFGLKFL